MTHQTIAEKLLFPLWRCISSDFKDRYKADAWGMFENFLKTAAACENLRSFLDKFKRLMPMDWQHQYESDVLSVIDSGADDFVLTSIRTECAYLVLLTRQLNEARKQKFVQPLLFGEE